MKKVVAAVILSGALGFSPALAQEKKDLPAKEGRPMKAEGMRGGGMMMEQMKKMQNRMGEMRKDLDGTMKGRAMMKSEDMQGMGKPMGEISEMVGNLAQMMGSGKMTPEEMQNMSKMMGDMSGMMKQMSERMGRGMKRTQ